MKIIVDGLAIEYADEGQGPILLLLHGWGDNLHTFDPLLRYISHVRVVRLDLPGFGGSERPRETWGVVEYARLVEAFCKKIHVDPDMLVGHSFGGRIIIKGVGTGIFSPKKIVLLASAGVARPRTLRRVLFGAVAMAGKALTRVPPLSRYRLALRKRLYGALGSDYFSAGSMRKIFVKVVREDLLEDAKKIAIPALLVWGSADRSTPLIDGEKIRDSIRNSTLEVLPGASHFLHHEQPDEIARLITHFL